MGKLGFFTVLTVVLIAHVLLLKSYIDKTSAVSKPKAHIHHITLTRVVRRKPQPPKLEIKPIIPPAIEKPVIHSRPRIIPKHKRKHKKSIKRVKVHPKKVLKKIDQPPVVHTVKQIIAPVQTLDTTSVKDKYTSEIRRQIRENLFYPKIAKRLHMQDIVQVAFRVQKDGTITNIKILNHPRLPLANGAIKTLHMLSLKPIPVALHRIFLDITIPIEFKLTQG